MELPLDDGLFDIPDFAAWSRALYRKMPLPRHTHLLFESTIEEPADALAKVIGAAFNSGMPDRFASVFGRGNPHVIRALAQRYQVAESHIVCATGASNAIAMTLRALIAPGDRILVERPGFRVLNTLAADAGARVEALPRRGLDFGIDVDEFRVLVRGARLVILSNLHNPSGQLITGEALAELARIAQEAGAMILVDEVYADFARGSGGPSAASISPNIISVNSLTKVFGLFSLRCGWIIAEPEIARRIAQSNASREFGVSKLAHAVAAHVLEQPQAFEAHWQGIVGASRPVIEKHLSAMEADGLLENLLPAHGCICFPRTIGILDTRALARTLWLKWGLLLAPGEFFDQPGHVRLGFGIATSQLEESLARLHEALRHYRQQGHSKASSQ